MPLIKSPISVRNNIADLSPARLLFLSFFAILIPATVLLMSPYAAKVELNWIDALFTATSALTVTGLNIIDTGTGFGVLGHIMLMILMELGGLGQMSITVLLLYIFGQRIGLRRHILVKEELNQTKPVNVIKLIKLVVVFSLSVQLLGFILLCWRWVPEFGWQKGLYFSLFHAISAFNNAGFSLFSDSLSGYADDGLINFTIISMLVIGGLGFTVVQDLFRYRKTKRLGLHSKLVLITSTTLLIVGAMVIFILEYNHTGSIGNIESLGGKVMAAFFQSATTRTAGFNTIDIASMAPASLFFMAVLMFIGAGSTSTGGGIKVSTFAVAIIATKTFLRGQKDFNIFKRRILPETVLRSLAIIVVSFFLLMSAMFILMITEGAPYQLIMFETLSAFSTVGLSVGLTQELTDAGKLVMCFVMLIGRIGPLTMAYLLTSAKITKLRYPDDDVITG